MLSKNLLLASRDSTQAEKKNNYCYYKLSILFLLLKSRWDKKVPLTASTARNYIEDFAHIFGKLTTPYGMFALGDQTKKVWLADKKSSARD